MEDLRDVHDVVCERTPAKDAPDSVWAAFYRWSAETYEQRGQHRHAETARYRATLYENPLTAWPPRRTQGARPPGTPPAASPLE